MPCASASYKEEFHVRERVAAIVQLLQLMPVDIDSKSCEVGRQNMESVLGNAFNVFDRLHLWPVIGQKMERKGTGEVSAGNQEKRLPQKSSLYTTLLLPHPVGHNSRTALPFWPPPNH